MSKKEKKQFGDLHFDIKVKSGERIVDKYDGLWQEVEKNINQKYL